MLQTCTFFWLWTKPAIIIPSSSGLRKGFKYSIDSESNDLCNRFKRTLRVIQLLQVSHCYANNSMGDHSTDHQNISRNTTLSHQQQQSIKLIWSRNSGHLVGKKTEFLQKTLLWSFSNILFFRFKVSIGFQ